MQYNLNIMEYIVEEPELIEENEENDDIGENEESKNILCILWKNGKMGAAYYNILEKLLYMYDEITDMAPQFLASRTLYREINPCHLLTFGNRGDPFVKVLIDAVNCRDDTTTSTSTKSNSMRALPKDMFLLSLKEYSYEICKAVLSQLTLAGFSAETEAKKLLHIQSLINFDYKMSVQAAGALVKYLEKNCAYFSATKDDLQFLYIHQVSIQKHVLMDWASFRSFQIFNQRSHEANFKRGQQSSSREGLSMFRLLSSNCKSKLGVNRLRNLLLNPIKDIDELNKRLDFIEFMLDPAKKEFIEAIQENIKELADINKILLKIQNSRANARQWQTLYKTIHRTIFINELSASYREESKLLDELCASISLDLISLEQTIDNALDFTSDVKQRRPVIKFGLDEDLDAKKLRRQDISKHVTAAARVTMSELPEFLNECSVIYLPEMGHLICVKEWEPNCEPEILANLGFQFMFTLRGMHHYKNPLCVELDRHLGDLNAEIIAHENRIIERLSGFVLKYNNDIRKPLRVISLMDSLISMGKVALNCNYVKPILNEERIHRIIEGRHPLMELRSHFEPNDFVSGGSNPNIKIITGPNGSGKSIYLKQVGLIIYLAHVGSYIPAKKAVIGMVHSFHSRIQMPESVSVRLSAFMIDISLATQAIQNARSSSLIILDEFGRGTLSEDALAILTVTLKSFMQQGENCPHILVSTHLHSIAEHLPKNSLVEYLKTTHVIKDDKFIFLYKITEGTSNSFALEIASQAGLNDSIISRAKEIYACLTSGNKMLQPLTQKGNYPSISEADISILKNVAIPPPDDD